MMQYFDSIVKEISNYSHGDAHVVWSNIAMMSTGGFLVINQGEAGSSKSYCSSDLARYLKLATDELNEDNTYTSPVVIFNGKTSDKGFFQFLEQHRRKKILFDDTTALTDVQKGILKDACGSVGDVSWYSSIDDSVRTFRFEGSIAINTNISPTKKDTHLDAVKTRGFVNTFLKSREVLTTKTELTWDNYVQGTDTKNYEVWKIIRNRMLTMEPLPLNMEERKRLAEWGKSFEIDIKGNVSLRDPQNIIKLCEWFKGFFGTFNDKVFQLAVSVAKYYYFDGVALEQSKTVWSFKEHSKTLSKAMLRRSELTAAMELHHHITARTAQRWLADAIEKGELEYGVNTKFVQIPTEIKEAKTIISDF